MKQLKRSLQAISKDLKSLTLRTEKVIKLLGKLEKGQTKAGVRKKTGAKSVVPKRVITFPSYSSRCLLSLFVINIEWLLLSLPGLKSVFVGSTVWKRA